MKFYGYSQSAQAQEDPQPQSLAEVVLSASPSELRVIAGFLSECAAEMERMGDVYDHIHLSDRQRSFESSPHFVVVREPG